MWRHTSRTMHTSSESKCGNAQANTCTDAEASVTKVKHANTKELKTQKILLTCLQLRKTASPMQARCECMCKPLQQSGMSTARAFNHLISCFSHHFSCPSCGKLCVGVLLIWCATCNEMLLICYGRLCVGVLLHKMSVPRMA